MITTLKQTLLGKTIAFILLGMTFAALAPSAFAESKDRDRPNFLFIMVDDLNDWIGAMGVHPDVQTPHIDRLAESGSLFLNAHCPAPICGPSRAALWTGRAPSTTGIYLHIADDRIQDNLPDDVEARFLPDLLEETGYHTLGAGKLFHNGDRAGVFDDYGPGFDFGPRPAAGFRLNFEPDWTGPFQTSTDWGAFPEDETTMPDYAIREWALSKLEGELPQPFFMGVGFVRPHVPWYVPQEWFELYEEAELWTPPYLPDDLEDVPAIARLLQQIPGFPTTEWAQMAGEWQAIVHAYLACTSFVDHQVGLVLDALAESPYADNTIIILASDHGYHLGEKNRFAKMALWERSTRIPLIVAGDGLPRGRRIDQPVNLMDLYPTVLELAGATPATPLEAHSLLPLIQDGTPAEWNHVARTTHGRNNHAIRDGRFRYIVYEDGSEELYDHDTDPWEHHNLAENPEFAPILQRLRAELPGDDAPLAAESHLPGSPFLRLRSEAWRKEQ